MLLEAIPRASKMSRYTVHVLHDIGYNNNCFKTSPLIQGEDSCEEDEDEEDDGFLVPHGYLSDGEGGDDLPAGFDPTGEALVCCLVWLVWLQLSFDMWF